MLKRRVGWLVVLALCLGAAAAAEVETLDLGEIAPEKVAALLTTPFAGSVEDHAAALKNLIHTLDHSCDFWLDQEGGGDINSWKRYGWLRADRRKFDVTLICTPDGGAVLAYAMDFNVRDFHQIEGANIALAVFKEAALCGENGYTDPGSYQKNGGSFYEQRTAKWANVEQEEAAGGAVVEKLIDGTGNHAVTLPFCGYQLSVCFYDDAGERRCALLYHNTDLAAPGPAAPTGTDAAAWTCPNGHGGNTGNFCIECGAPKPADDGAWTCPNGHGGNTGNFCIECGAPKPADDGAWTCPNGHGGNTGNFCVECGAPKP